ncbi:MAG TPA: hypothetical protein VIK04_16950 [Solirubrobacteraceae bacterium]
MTTIIVINAISSLLAGCGIGAAVVRQNRRVRRESAVQPVYVTVKQRRADRQSH